jgi:hypothetical protein
MTDGRDDPAHARSPLIAPASEEAGPEAILNAEGGEHHHPLPHFESTGDLDGEHSA